MYQKFEIINHFTSKFKDCRYLEVGSFERETFNLIKASLKHDVEPNPQQGYIPSFLDDI